MLKVGWIDYANCTPLLLQIQPELAAAGIELRHGVPAQLNIALERGEIDLCISSSIEFARHAQCYQLLPGHCIGSSGAVQSVLLLTNRPVEELAGVELLVTAESATSVVLLQILLAEHWGIAGCTLQATSLPWREALHAAPGVLVIGDSALQARRDGGMAYQYDLGEAWYAMTGLPFVYALWQINRSSVTQKHAQIGRMLQLLDQARDRITAHITELADQAPEAQWLGKQPLADYWGHIDYTLDQAHLDGLGSFYRLACKQGLLPSVPTPVFWEN